MKKLGGNIKHNEQGEVVEVDLRQITVAGLVHLKGLTELQNLYLAVSMWDSQGIDGGLVHIQGLTKLKTLHLGRTRVSASDSASF